MPRERKLKDRGNTGGLAEPVRVDQKNWLPSSDNSTTTSCAGLESLVRYRKNGHDTMSVVDAKLKIYGVDSLSYCRCFYNASRNKRQHDGALRFS
jgi:hypothetical protein